MRPWPASRGHPNGRKCHEKYPMSCNAQWRRLEVCMEQLESIECAGVAFRAGELRKSRGAPVDWVLRVRPDMLFRASAPWFVDRCGQPWPSGTSGSFMHSGCTCPWAAGPTCTPLAVCFQGCSAVEDTFAIIPRQFAEVYFSTCLGVDRDRCTEFRRQYDGTEYCWVSPRENIRPRCGLILTLAGRMTAAIDLSCSS